MILEKQVFTYKSFGFTKYVERFDNRWELKILSNKDSDLVFQSVHKSMCNLHFLKDDVFEVLDKYVAQEQDEFELIGAYLMGVSISE